MTHENIIGAFVAGLIVTVFFLWLRSSPIDAEAGIVRGYADESPTPDLLACQCSACRNILCSDRRWLPESAVPLPIGCRISHGVCPSCERRAVEGVETLAGADKRSGCATIAPVENAAPILRPA